MKNITYKVFALSGVAFLVLLVNACLKDDPRFNDFSNVGNTIEFLDQTAGKSTAHSFADITKADTIVIRIHQAGAYATKADLTCTLGFLQSGIDLYNLDKAHVPGTALPADAYSYPSTVTIKAGDDGLGNQNRTATFLLIIDPTNVPTTPGINYVLSLGVTAVSPTTTISANNGVILFNFYKNPYDGSYHRSGTAIRVPNPPDVIDEDDDLVTINATTSSSIVSYFGNPGLSFFVVVAADNSVEIAADAAALYPITGGGTYDPVAKKFTVTYKYTNSSGNDRSFDETWVHN